MTLEAFLGALRAPEKRKGLRVVADLPFLRIGQHVSPLGLLCDLWAEATERGRWEDTAMTFCFKGDETEHAIYSFSCDLFDGKNYHHVYWSPEPALIWVGIRQTDGWVLNDPTRTLAEMADAIEAAAAAREAGLLRKD